AGAHGHGPRGRPAVSPAHAGCLGARAGLKIAEQLVEAHAPTLVPEPPPGEAIRTANLARFRPHRRRPRALSTRPRLYAPLADGRTSGAGGAGFVGFGFGGTAEGAQGDRPVGVQVGLGAQVD